MFAPEKGVVQDLLSGAKPKTALEKQLHSKLTMLFAELEHHRHAERLSMDKIEELRNQVESGNASNVVSTCLSVGDILIPAMCGNPGLMYK